MVKCMSFAKSLSQHLILVSAMNFFSLDSFHQNFNYMNSILNNRSFDTFISVYVKNNNNAYFPWISETTATSVKF